MGKLGAAARNKNLSPKERSTSARKAAVARWKKYSAAAKLLNSKKTCGLL
jgi:hypothetical protein